MSSASPSLAAQSPFASRLSRPDQTSTAQCRAILDQVFRQTVISRLCLAHQTVGGGSAAHTADDQPDAATELAAALCRGPQGRVDQIVDRLLDEHGIESFFFDTIQHVDRLIWKSAAPEAAAQATLATWRLAETIERLSPSFQSGPSSIGGTAAFLVQVESAPRGVLPHLLEECLTRDGWDVWRAPRHELETMTRAVSQEWFGLAVLLAPSGQVEPVAASTRAIRKASCNPEIRILVVSEALARRPDRMARVGADAAAADVRQSCVQALRMRSLMRRKR